MTNTKDLRVESVETEEDMRKKCLQWFESCLHKNGGEIDFYNSHLDIEDLLVAEQIYKNTKGLSVPLSLKEMIEEYYE